MRGQLDPRAAGTSRRTRRIAATSWVTVSWVATASSKIVESSTRRPRPAAPRSPPPPGGPPRRSAAADPRRACGSPVHQHRGVEPLVVQAQPTGDLPGDVAPQRADRLPVRQALQGLQHHHRGDHLGRHRRVPAALPVRSANSSGGNSWWRWSARKAYTDPSGTRWRHQVAASSWSSEAWLGGHARESARHQPSSANYRIDTANRIDRTTPVQRPPWRGYASALVAPLGHATVVGDHVHAIRLANAVADQARRQVTAGHPRSSGPHLRPAVPHPQAAGDRGRAAHRAGTGAAAGPRHHEDRTRGRQVGESRQHQVAVVVGSSVTVPNRGSMRTRSSPATSKFRNPPGSSAGCHRRDWCRVRRPPGATPDMRGVERCHRWALAGRRSRTDSSDVAYGRKPPRGGGLRSCRTTLLATCRWRG